MRLRGNLFRIINIGISLVIFLIILAMLFFGFWGQIIDNGYKTAFLLEGNAATYAFNIGNNIYYWQKFRLNTFKKQSLSEVIFTDYCSFDAKLVRKKFAYFDDIKITLSPNGLTGLLKQIKSGSSVKFQKGNSEKSIIIISNYVILGKNKICL